jgi:hypothetical protein
MYSYAARETIENAIMNNSQILTVNEKSCGKNDSTQGSKINGSK